VTRVACVALLTRIALSEWRSWGVVITKFSGHAVTLRSSPTVFADKSDVSIFLDVHAIGQSAKCDLERRHAFGLVLHRTTSAFAPPIRCAGHARTQERESSRT
jgi:hypothetical protein